MVDIKRGAKNNVGIIYPFFVNNFYYFSTIKLVAQSFFTKIGITIDFNQ